MPYLVKFEAPNLEEVDSTLRWQLQAGIVFHARQFPHVAEAGRLLSTYVIVVDKAIREYRTGQDQIRQHMADGGGIQAYVEGVGHFENCINSTKRALRLLTRLANEQYALEIDRTIRRLAQVWSKEVTDVRDAIEHIDKDIVAETGLPDGSAHLLTISNDGTRLEIGTHRLTFTALHATLQTLFRAGKAMIEALPTPLHTTDA